MYRVERFELEPDRHELRASGVPIPLRHKTFELLVYLLRHRDRVVPREELLREIWPGIVISENSVAQCVAELRRALGDEREPRRLIRTFGRAGYRFVGPAEEVAPLLTPPEPVPSPASRRRQFILTGLVMIAPILAILAWLGFRPGPSGSVQAVESAGLSTSNLAAARAYTLGVELARQYHPAESIERFEEALRLDPGFIMARARIGYVYSVRWLWEEKGRLYLESAYAARGQLSERDRLYILAWYDLAHRDYEAAIAHFRQLLAKFPHETEAREELGRVLAGEGRYDEARSELYRAIEHDPATAQAHNFLATTYMATHDFQQAVREAREFVRLQPGEVNAHDTLGLALEAANDFEQAERTYRWILARQPKFGSRIHLANTLFKLGRWREARQEIGTYIANAASGAERQWGYDQLAVIALRQGKADEVLHYASFQPPEGYHDQEILLWLRRGDLMRASRLLTERAVHADRGQRANDRLLLYVRGEYALASGQPARALELFRHAVAQRTPMYAIDWYEDCLADALRRLGRFDQAIAEYHRVLAIYPRLASAWYGLAQAFQANGDAAQARLALQRVAGIWKHGDADLPELVAARAAVSGGERSDLQEQKVR